MKTHRTTIVDGSFECPCVWQNGIELTGIPCDPICCTHKSGFVVGRLDSNAWDHKPYPVPAIRTYAIFGGMFWSIWSHIGYGWVRVWKPTL